MSDPYKGYECEHCLARFVYNDSLDRHRSECPGTERLRLKVADLKKRIRLARLLIPSANGDDVQRGFRALDLRKPLRAKEKR